jgi:hypothetical protein
MEELEPICPGWDNISQVGRATSRGGGTARGRNVRIAIAALRDIKRALTVEGDVASDVGFQNDVNTILATISRLSPVGPAPPDLPRAVAREEMLGPSLRRPRTRR